MESKRPFICLSLSHTVIKKDKVLYPNASSIDFNSKINLICELQKDPYIINCIGKNNSINFERANFKKSKNINPRPKANEIGVNHKNEVFNPDNPNTLIGVSSGAGDRPGVFVFKKVIIKREQIAPVEKSFRIQG